MSKIILPEKFCSQIFKHAKETYPEECCGVLIGRIEDSERVVTNIYKTKNTHEENRNKRYIILPDDYKKADSIARQIGADIIGFYHSHPDHPPVPSEYDREYAWPWFFYIIVGIDNVESHSIRCWSLSDERDRFNEINLFIEEYNKL